MRALHSPYQPPSHSKHFRPWFNLLLVPRLLCSSAPSLRDLCHYNLHRQRLFPPICHVLVPPVVTSLPQYLCGIQRVSLLSGSGAAWQRFSLATAYHASPSTRTGIGSGYGCGLRLARLLDLFLQQGRRCKCKLFQPPPPIFFFRPASFLLRLLLPPPSLIPCWHLPVASSYRFFSECSVPHVP